MSGFERALAAGLGAGRVAIGAGIWLAPGATFRALGLAGPGRDSLVLARIAASRDLVLGAAQLAALGRPERMRAATAAAAASDAGDSLAFALMLRQGGGAGAVRGLAGAVPATIAGLWLARRASSTA